MSGSSEAAAAEAEKARREARAEAAAAVVQVFKVEEDEDAICCWLASRRATEARASEPRAMLGALCGGKGGEEEEEDGRGTEARRLC